MKLHHNFATKTFLVVGKRFMFVSKKAYQKNEKIMFQIHKTSTTLEELKIN